MKELNRERVKEVSDKIQTFLDKLSEEEGIKMTMNGGRFTADSFTLKIAGKLLDEETGAVVISDASNSIADRAAREKGISFKAPHIIGSVWNFRSSGLVNVIDYSSKNRKYPFIVKTYEDGRRLKAAASSFTSEVVPPTREEFYKWFTIDPDDDAVSPKDEAICDRVNDYVSCRFMDNASLDGLFDACSEYYDSVSGKESKDRDVAANAFLYLIEQGNLMMAEAYIRKQL